MMDAAALPLRLSPAVFETEIPAGGTQRFVLNLEGENSGHFKGLCYSDNPRVQLETRSFVGRRCHISFYVSAAFLAPGSVLYGSISLITNAGEYSVPYRFETVAESKEVPEEIAENKAPAEHAEEDKTPVNAAAAAPKQTESAGPEEAEVEQAQEAYLGFLAENFPEDDVLMQELCAMLIREQVAGRFAFLAYAEAIRRDLNLTQLYESYIYAYPKGETAPLPESLLLYFSYGNTLEPSARAIVYENVLRYVDPASELYRSYEPQIRDYCIDCVLKRQMNEHLALIYDRMIYPNMIDRKAAEVLPDLLKCCRVEAEDRRLTSFTIRYPELSTQTSYPLEDGVGYAPVYFDNAVLTAFDAAGRPSAAPLRLWSLLRKPALLKRCFALAPGHPMLKLSAAKEILAGDSLDEVQTEILRDVLRSLPLSASMRESVVSLLSRKAEGEPAWIADVNPDLLTDRVRTELMEAMLRAGHPEQAYALLQRYGLHLGNQALLEETALKLMQVDRFPRDEDGAPESFFLSLCRQLFDGGSRERAILELLTEYYEGASEDMYRILAAAREAGAALHELPEKALVVKLFADERTHLDECFAAYVENCAQKELLVRAYFTVRCNDYFVAEQEAPESLFEALYSYLSAEALPEKLPVIYLLALTKHYAFRDSLLEEEKNLCQKLVDLLISEGLVFRYTKQLKKKIAIPPEICERYYLEYHGDREQPPKLLVKLLPQEQSFHAEEMARVYQGIYVWSTILFVQDELRYLIYGTPDAAEADEEGVITVRKIHRGERGRYQQLNQMTKAWAEQDNEALAEEMLAYFRKDAVNRMLFTVGERV